MTISAFPTPTPSRSQDQDTFDAAVEAFLTHLPTFVSEANATAAAMNLNSTTDTSASSVAIGTGAKTFTVSASKSFLGGMYVVIADAAAPSTNLMVASITSYSGTTLVVDVKYVLGSGTKTSWIISQSAPAADIAAQIHGATNKTTPVGADEIGIWDSVSGLINRVSFTNMLNWFAAKAGSAAQAFACLTLTPATGIVGKSDGTSAGAGMLGEPITSAVPSGTPVSLTTATAANVSSITLTPGRWLVFTETFFLGDGTTSITIHSAGMNTTSATYPTENRYVDIGPAFVPAAGVAFGENAGPYYISVSVDTIVYHIARATFTVSTLAAYGTIKAIRI